MTSRNTLALIALLAVVALGLGACSDSSTPEDTDTDTTAPLVVGTTPTDNAIQVATNAAISVTFNEDMAPASATGQVTLSSGGTPSVIWQDARTFTVTHSALWAEGTQVTVTVGAGLADAAGNALGTPYSFSFFTETSAFVLVATDPAEGATGVNRSTGIRLQFSLTPDQGSITDNVTITDPTAKRLYAFSVSDGGGNGWVTLDPVDEFAAVMPITVSIGAGVHALGSPLNALGTAAALHFTTSVSADTTPPTIVSLSPANGATNVPADVGAFVVTFSEPVDPATFQPVSWNVEFFLVVMQNAIEPVWSSDNTVMTVGLPPLAAGLEMEVTFAGYADLSGNVQSAATTWSAKVAGTADIYPMTDGAVQYWETSWSEGLPGNPVPVGSGNTNRYRRLEVQPNDDAWVVDYPDATLTAARHWNMYDRLTSAIDWLGFADVREDQSVEEIVFDTPLKFLPLPMAIGTWSDNSTVTTGAGTFEAVYTGHVIRREDLAPPQKASPSPLYYKDAWKVARTLEVTLNGAWFITQSDTTWYSPTLGPVREITHEDSAANGNDPAGWYHTESWLNPLGPPTRK